MGVELGVQRVGVGGVGFRHIVLLFLGWIVEDEHSVFVGEEPEVFERAQAPALAEGLFAFGDGVGVVEVPVAGEGVLLGFGVGGHFGEQLALALFLLAFAQGVYLGVDEVYALLFGEGGDGEEAVVTGVDGGVGHQLGEDVVAVLDSAVVRIVGGDDLHGSIIVYLSERVVLVLLVEHLSEAYCRACLAGRIVARHGHGEAVVVAGALGVLEAEVHLAFGVVNLVAVFFVLAVVEHIVELPFEFGDVGRAEGSYVGA